MDSQQRHTVLKYHRYGPDGNTIAEALNIGVGRLPERRRQALYLCEPGKLTPIAYFLSDEYADLVSRLFERILTRRGYFK